MFWDRKIDRYRSIRFDSRGYLGHGARLRARLDWADFHRLESLLEGFPRELVTWLSFPRRSQS